MRAAAQQPSGKWRTQLQVACLIFLFASASGCASMSKVGDLTTANLVGQDEAVFLDAVAAMKPAGTVACKHYPTFDSDPRLLNLTDGSLNAVKVYGCEQPFYWPLTMTCSRVLVVTQYDKVVFVSEPMKTSKGSLSSDSDKFCRTSFEARRRK